MFLRFRPDQKFRNIRLKGSACPSLLFISVPPTAEVVLLALYLLLCTACWALTKQTVPQQIPKPEEGSGITTPIGHIFRVQKLQEEMVFFWSISSHPVSALSLCRLEILIEMFLHEAVAIPQTKMDALLKSWLLVGEEHRQGFLS